MNVSVNEALLFLLVVGQVVDGVLTLKVFARGGKELNPLIVWLDERLGKIGSVVAVKAAVIGAAVAAHSLRLIEGQPLTVALAAVVAFYVAVSVRNYHVLKKLGG